MRLLYKAASTPIKRHVKVRAAANSFLKKYVKYFEKRKVKPRFKPWWSLLPLLPARYYYWT